MRVFSKPYSDKSSAANMSPFNINENDENRDGLTRPARLNSFYKGKKNQSAT